MASAYGLKAYLVSDPAIDPSLRARFDILGVTCDVVQADETGSYQRPRLSRLHEVMAQHPHPFWVNQYDNPLNAESYFEIADGLAEQIGAREIEHLVAPVGSGGSSSGLTRQFRKHGHRCMLHAVDTPASVLFGCRDGKRPLRGLGNSIMPANVAHELVDSVDWVPAAIAFNAARWLYRHLTIDVGPTSGAAFVAAQRVAARYPGELVVVVCPDDGERYRHDVLCGGWLSERGLLVDPMAAVPRAVSHPLEVGSEWAFFDWGRRHLGEVMGCSIGRMA